MVVPADFWFCMSHSFGSLKPLDPRTIFKRKAPWFIWHFKASQGAAPFLGEKFTFFGWPLRTLTVFKNVIKKPINAKFSTKSGVHQKIPWQIAVGVRLQKVHCPLPRGPSSLRLPFIFATNTKFSVWLKPRYFHFTSFVLLARGLCSGAGSPAKQ